LAVVTPDFGSFEEMDTNPGVLGQKGSDIIRVWPLSKTRGWSAAQPGHTGLLVPSKLGHRCGLALD